MFVDFNILNQLGSPSINSNTFANRPSAGQVGRLFVSTDTFEIYRDNGTGWDLIGGPGSSTVTGSGAAGQVTYWTGTNSVGGENNLWWDAANNRFGVNTNTPTAAAEVVQTDGVALYSNFTTNAGSGAGTTAILAKNTTNGSGYAAVIEERTPNVSAGQYPVLIRHTLSSGTAATNMATGIHFGLPDDAGTERINQFSMDTVDAAAATYSSRYRFLLRNNGSAVTPFYITGTGLGVFTATPGAALDIHSTGIIAQFNTTSGTGNTYIAFQRTGTGIWRIGDTYNGGNNFFELHNTVLGVDAMELQASTNKSTFQAQETYTTGQARGNYFDYNLSVAAGGSFSSPNAITSLGASLDLTLAGNATIPSGARSGLDAYNTIAFTGTGTLTQNQGSQLRTYANLTTGWAFNGSATGTITHLSGIHVRFPDNSGSAVTITNNYGLLINDQTANTGTVTYTNRWGIYQEGSSDLNYMAANLLLGSTTNNGNKLQVTGNGNLTGDMTADAYYLNGMTAGNGALYWTSDRVTLANYNSNGVLHFEVNGGAFAAMFDASGNLGLGVTPSAWSVGSTFDISTKGSLHTSSTIGLLLGRNVYYDGSYKYKSTGVATALIMDDGGYSWQQAPSGTAGNAITFTQAMTLNSSGNLLLGTTTGLSSGRQEIVAQSSNGALLSLGVTGTSDSFQLVCDSGPNALIINKSNTPMIFYTNNTRRVDITAGGNVLIGTTTDAGQKLQVSGDISVTGSGAFSSTNPLVFAYAGNADIWMSGNGQLRVINQAYTIALFNLSNTGDASVYGSVTTGAPTGGTAAAWKLGSRVAATVVVNTTEYIEVDIGGTLYKLATVT